MQKSKIEWTDCVWNPVTGCLHNCQYCYARKMANRLKGRYGYPADEPFKPTFHKLRLWDTFPIKPSRIFVSSMGDLFGDWVPTEWINQVLDLVKINYKHTFIFLTKNPKRYSNFYIPQNAWIGYSTTGKLYHKWDIDHQDNVKFVSLEPMAEAMSASLEGYIHLINFQWLIIGAETGNRTGKYIVTENMLQSTIKIARKVGMKIFVKNNLRDLFDNMMIDLLKVRSQEYP
jgi:protein gp37